MDTFNQLGLGIIASLVAMALGGLAIFYWQTIKLFFGKRFYTSKYKGYEGKYYIYFYLLLNDENGNRILCSELDIKRRFMRQPRVS